MSDVEQSRDESTGQFAPSTEGLYGREAELANAGYTVKKDAPADETTYGSDTASLREAAQDHAASRPKAPDLGAISAPALIDADAKEAVTVDQAAKQLATARGDISRYVEGANLAGLQDAIDKGRLAELRSNPNAAQNLGLTEQDVAAAEQSQSKRVVADNLAAEAGAKLAAPSTEGLDAEVEKALKHPQVRQAIEEELGKAETAKQNYATALNTAHQYAQANLLDHLPELAQVPTEQWAAAIGILNQSDPQRVARAVGVLQRVDQLQTAQAQWQHMQAEQQREQFESFAKAEDQRFDQMPAWAGLSETEKATISKAVVEYAGELGIDRPTLAHLMQSNPVMRHSAFQMMMVDAARYRLVDAAKKQVLSKSVPAVQRPGVSGAAKSHANQGKIASVEKQLANATGHKAIKLAAQLSGLRRSAGGR